MDLIVSSIRANKEASSFSRESPTGCSLDSEEDEEPGKNFLAHFISSADIGVAELNCRSSGHDDRRRKGKSFSFLMDESASR